MSQTFLLPPVSAVRMIWARTGMFSNDTDSKNLAALTEAALKNIKDRAEADDKERKYVDCAIATMDATLRSLDIIHKGRTLNFEENEKLRKASLDQIKENLEFGKNTRDFLKSLPAMVIGGAGGFTVAQHFQDKLGISDITLWAIGLALASIGYIVNLGVVRLMRKRKQMLYIAQDYERNVYYDQYVTRVATTLTSLYLDLDRIHKNVFEQSYSVGVEVSYIIEEMLKGVRPTFCEYIHKHIMEKRIKPELWALCETGKVGAVEKCPYWEGKEH